MEAASSMFGAVYWRWFSCLSFRYTEITCFAWQNNPVRHAHNGRQDGTHRNKAWHKNCGMYSFGYIFGVFWRRWMAFVFSWFLRWSRPRRDGGPWSRGSSFSAFLIVWIDACGLRVVLCGLQACQVLAEKNDSILIRMIPMFQGNLFEWMVRSWGIHTRCLTSSWSGTRRFQDSMFPSVAQTTPNACSLHSPRCSTCSSVSFMAWFLTLSVDSPRI